MGGSIFANVAEMAGKAIGSAFSKDAGSVVGKTAGAELVERGVYRGIFSDKRAFAEHPYAAKIYEDFHNIYQPKVDQYTSQLGKQAIAAGQKPEMHELERAAANRASNEVFGPKQVRLQAMLKQVQRDKGKSHADILSNHLNVMLKSEPIKEGAAKGRSLFDLNMARGGTEPRQPGIDTPISPYRGRAGYEQGVGTARATLAYKAAMLHATTATVNMAADRGVSNLAKTLGTIWGNGREAAIANLKASDFSSEYILQDYKDHLAFQKSGIAKYAPGSVGEFMHRNLLIPGMNLVRRETIAASAISGKIAAQEAAAHLEHGNEKMALPLLRTLGIDANKLKRNNFQLDPEDIRQAYHHGANNLVFLRPYEMTPSFWRQMPATRSIKAFSGYITRQSAFEKELIMRQYRQGDFMGIARNIGLKSVAYPVVGATLVEMEKLLTGQDWDAPEKHYQNRLEYTPAGMAYDLVAGRNNAVNTARTVENSLDMLSRLGVWGSTTGYVQGANRAHLLQHFAPPELNIGVQLIEDLDKGMPWQKHPQFRTFAKDAAAEVPGYGIPRMLVNKLLAKDPKPKHFRVQRKPTNTTNWTY